MQQREPKQGDIYRHFKNKMYEVITLAIHSETEEDMVVYRQKYGEEKVYVRPLAMFLSEVDHEKYPEVTQRYRFELVEEEENKKEIEEQIGKSKESDDNDFLIRFLDAADYREKLIILEDAPEELEDRVITNMALSVDLVVDDGPPDERLAELTQCLKTKARFECFRFR